MYGQGGCERRIEVFVKIQKKNGGGGQGGCERRIEVFEKIKQVAQRATIAHLRAIKVSH